MTDEFYERYIKLNEAYDTLNSIQSTPYFLQQYIKITDQEIIDIINDASKRASIRYDCTTLDILSYDIRILLEG